MSALSLNFSDLRVIINPNSLTFSDTSELVGLPLSWIGQERAEVAARFGLSIEQLGYHLFVLGKTGSGRSSLMKQAVITAAASTSKPPDLCYLYNFVTPEKPLALYLPAGQGRLLRQALTQLTKSLPAKITQSLNGQDFKIKKDSIEGEFKAKATQSYTELKLAAESLHFSIHPEGEQIIFAFLDETSGILSEEELLNLPRARRNKIKQAEQQMREAILLYFEEVNKINQEKNTALAILQRHIVQPIAYHALEKIQVRLRAQSSPDDRLKNYFQQIESDILDNLILFIASTNGKIQSSELNRIFSRYQINLAVDNADLQGAPVIMEDNPSVYTLFGRINYQFDNGELKTNLMHIGAGSLHEAHGGFLILYLEDLQTDNQLWTKLRRFLRNRRLQIEEPCSPSAFHIPISLKPEAVEVNVKIILIGSREEYYALHEGDPEFMQHFRVKVDFADSFIVREETYHASAIFVAHTCNNSNLPHFSAAAVARLMEESHREVDDQERQSAIFARTEMLVLESALLCSARQNGIVEVVDIDTALQARTLRHNYSDVSLQESIIREEISILLQGFRVGQLNALMQIDVGDHCFGVPVRVTARTFAGGEGILNICREVGMSGPIHDKGMLILQNYLAALFSHIAPLALNASIVLEQEYSGIEGDSASCAEFYALLSSLAEIPLNQSVAVTGALNQYGEVLPVGGINDKIEGYFSLCEKNGLTGGQGVLIPYHNRRHLMLNYKVIEAVKKGLFAIYTMKDVVQGLELLTGLSAGTIKPGRTESYLNDTVLGNAQKKLLIFRRACQMMQHPLPEYRKLPSRAEKR